MTDHNRRSLPGDDRASPDEVCEVSRGPASRERGEASASVLDAGDAGPVAARSDAAPAADPVIARRARVLVIDDEPGIARILQRGLSRHHAVVVANQACDALARIERGEVFDVILCDLMMPDVTGMDVHEYLVREHPAIAGRVVFMTGGAFTSRARQFLSTVSNERIDKPFSLSLVKQIIDRQLDHHGLGHSLRLAPP